MSTSLFGAPALSWDAILNIMKVKLELISDLDMYIFFEKNMRGRVSYIYNRYSKANNKYLEPRNSKQELDTNNLYCCAMSKSSNKWIQMVGS